MRVAALVIETSTGFEGRAGVLETISFRDKEKVSTGCEVRTGAPRATFVEGEARGSAPILATTQVSRSVVKR